jgi:hypothetical protein
MNELKRVLPPDALGSRNSGRHRVIESEERLQNSGDDRV